MNIKLNTRKVFAKLHGNFSLIWTSKKLSVIVPNSTHIDLRGRSLSMSDLAFWLINGTATIPARPFPEDARKQLRKQVYTLLKEHTTVKLKNTKDPNKLSEIYVDFTDSDLREKLEQLVKWWLLDGSYYKSHVPNAPSTIANKGSDVPLVDTGQLVNSIQARIEK